MESPNLVSGNLEEEGGKELYSRTTCTISPNTPGRKEVEEEEKMWKCFPPPPPSPYSGRRWPQTLTHFRRNTAKKTRDFSALCKYTYFTILAS